MNNIYVPDTGNIALTKTVWILSSQGVCILLGERDNKID